MLTPHDSSVLSRLVQFRLPEQRRLELLSGIEDEDARKVGEVVLDPQKYDGASADVRASVDRFNGWHEANRRLGKQRLMRSRRMWPHFSASTS